MPNIEIDDEVFEFLQRNAVPLVDTPNSVLRRFLLDDHLRTHPMVKPPVSNPKPATRFSSNAPIALQQILEIILQVRGRGLTRQDATRLVAKRRGVAYQTVLDKYARQLGLGTERFDDLLKEKGLVRLRNHLIERFPSHRRIIGETLDSIMTQNGKVLRCPSCGFTRPVFRGWQHAAGSACTGVTDDGSAASLLHPWEEVEMQAE